MFRITRIILTLCSSIVIILSGCQVKERTFSGEGFSFTIPEGWQTMEEVWDKPLPKNQDHYGLGLAQQVMIQYPPEQGEGNAFFAVATVRLSEGQDITSIFTQAYQKAEPEIKDPTQQAYQLGDLSGIEIVYMRPWGEPWWKFRDIWLEKDGMIYLLSFHTSEQSFEKHMDTFDQILESIKFSQ